MPREDYRDDARTRQHALALADAMAKSEMHENGGWPIVALQPVLPSQRDMIVRALRELAEKLPTE